MGDSQQYLTRRIPQNPKYQHIKTRLDTGNSLSKYVEKLEEIKRRQAGNNKHVLVLQPIWNYEGYDVGFGNSECAGETPQPPEILL
ncbi:hypothetical protein WISP_69092 [Willisornis vidua]|uniref:Uncharacterized protein n=1 Tax=Willisornis vidua TaxID=1566151 RepID=A0ABQ9DDN1_9PASS|nr:hypothetical protein WISP_69092 [Willisornis vidua]